MDTALLLSGSEKGAALLSGLLSASNPTTLTLVKSGSEARRLLLNGTFSQIVINTPLTDEFGTDTAIFAARTTTSGVVLLVKSELADELCAKLSDEGIAVVGKPVSKAVLHQALRLSLASHKRLSGLREENLRLHGKLAELQLIGRAKCVLIEHLKLTEPQAHRYLEKQAMDMRITREEAARAILQTYEP